MNSTIKHFLPHIAAFFILMAVAFIYFLPSVTGKVLRQTDNFNAYGMQAEMKKYEEAGDRPILWTNSAFSGMPTYQLRGSARNNLLLHPYRAFVAWNSVTIPHTALFLLMLGFYILMVAMGVDWRIGIMGAIAYGLCTNYVILMEAGHSTKLIALAYTPAALAGVLLAYRGKYLLGAGMTAFFLGLQITANHLQITYYLLLILAIYGIFKLIDAIRNNQLPNFAKATGALVIATILAFAANTSNLWTTQEYAKETIRGKSELAKKAGQDGLTKEYAFGWSYGIGETMTLMFPNARGGGSLQSGEGTEIYDVLLRQVQGQGASGNQAKAYAAQQAGSIMYWGDQPFTSGPIHYGAIVCFLFFLGTFLVKGPIKWWLITASILVIVLSWGKNFFFNDLMFDYFPFYDKFRSVKMILNLGLMLFILMGALGLQRFFSNEISTAQKRRALMYAGGIAGGICLLMLLGSSMLSFSGANDPAQAEIREMLSADRAGLLRADVIRAFLFILAAAGALWAYTTGRFKSAFAIPTIAILVLIEAWSVSTRYVNSDSFEEKSSITSAAQATPADTQIMNDKDPYFRVFDLARGGLRGNATTSYFHKSLSGYHAAKLMIYEELIEAYNLGDVNANSNILDMLNTKYLITGGRENPPQAVPRNTNLGNAWFVNDFKLVENADAELQGLKNLNPRTTALVQKKYSDYLSGLNLRSDSLSNAGNSIRLTDYHPNRLTYESNANSEQLAVFSDIYYPPNKGWQVYIDDQATDDDFIKADYVLRAMRVPAGKHKIEMRFEPRSFYTGETISLIGSLMALLCFVGGMVYWGRNTNFSELRTGQIYDPEPAVGQTKKAVPKKTVKTVKETPKKATNKKKGKRKK